MTPNDEPKPDPELTERCLEVAEEIEAIAGREFSGTQLAAIETILVRELRAERVKVRRETAKESELAFIGAYGDQEQPLIGVMYGLKAIRALAETGERDGG